MSESPAYVRLCRFINDTPEVMSALYDLNLLPEQVNDKKTATRKMCMMAFVWGYKMAKGLPMDDASRPEGGEG